MSTDGNDRMVELVAENPALDPEGLVEIATDEGIDADDGRQWLEDAEVTGDVLEVDDKYGIVREPVRKNLLCRQIRLMKLRMASKA